MEKQIQELQKKHLNESIALKEEQHKAVEELKRKLGAKCEQIQASADLQSSQYQEVCTKLAKTRKECNKTRLMLRKALAQTQVFSYRSPEGAGGSAGNDAGGDGRDAVD